ncbi:MAG: PilC/PilY family type IV pilus protein [Georgfuchsia sp.]
MNATPGLINKAGRFIAIGLATAILGPAASATDLSDVPLASSSADAVKPNIFFILDDSGSMDRDYMPDSVNTSKAGYLNHRCNTIYYNPNLTYEVPKNSSGTPLHNASPATYTAACSNGFSGSSCSTNLGTKYYWEYTGTNTALSWPTSGSNDCTLDSDTSKTGICSDGSYVTNTPASCTSPRTLVWRRITEDSASSDAQNYANWYSYYRKRLMMMKAAAGQAFQDISDNYRVGFMTISPGTYGNDQNSSGAATGSSISSSKFLKIADFDTDHRDDWYTILYGQSTSSYTPLRSALSTAGRYYAGKNDLINKGMVPAEADDPVQYSCQQNFTILTTDGYWNSGGGKMLNGTTTMDNEDGVLAELDAYRPVGSKYAMSPRPIFDGASQTYTWNEAQIAYQYASCSYNHLQTKTVQWQSRAASTQERTSSLQAQTSTLQARTATLQTSTSSNSGSSWSSWSNTTSCQWDNSGSGRRRCQYADWTDWSDTGSCSPQSQGTNTSNNQTWSGPATECQYTDWTAWSDVSSCDVISKDTRGTWSRGTARNCQYTDWTDWTDVGSCTAVAKDNSDPYNVGTARECQTGYGSWSDTTGTCTDSATLQCQSVDLVAWANVDSCTPSGPDTSGQEVLCQTALIPSGKKIQYQATTTTTVYPGPNKAGTILSGPDSTSDPWTDDTGTCYPDGSEPALPSDGEITDGGPPTPPDDCLSGFQVWPCETASAGGASVSASINSLSVSGSADPYTVTAGTSSAHPFIVGQVVNITGVTSAYRGTYPITDIPDSTHFSYQVSTNPYISDHTGTASLSQGSSNSLADVAQYYYKTDLRNATEGNCTGGLGVSVCDNNVPSTGTGNEDDRANWQHMTTFTMGLGVTGTVEYSPTYRGDSPTNIVTWPDVDGQITGRLDFQDIRNGTSDWPGPQADSATAIDDLWHAAVNGRGQYFSAADPTSVADALSTALSGISARVGSAAAAATSNLEPVAGDNFAYTASYVTQDWVGELVAREINLSTGTVGTNNLWSAQTQLDAKVKAACDNRVIKLFHEGATNNLVNFSWNTYACDIDGNPTGSAQTELDSSEKAYFAASKVALLTQYSSMTAGQQTAAQDANLVNFLRGQRGNEGWSSDSSSVTDLYRTRLHVLGDIINAQPVFVKGPFAEYDDAGYADYKTANSARAPIVYSAANDGMLHAYNAETGVETWAFMPTMVLPELYKLASSNYSSQHIFYTDGTPTVGDAFDTTASADCAEVTPVSPQNCWKTILVSGLNKGGKGYYALDITDPASPRALWEFKYSTTCYDAANSATHGADCHIGYTFNNPIISKLNDGRWVVFVTSGYNNVNSPTLTGDGEGYLYVLDAFTGQIIYKIGTGEGTAANPSGLNHINGWVNLNSLKNNITDRVYGGDLNGNIWRFDINDLYDPAGREATLVAQVVDGSGVPQPITTKPELSEVHDSPFVYVATGRYLGSTDLSNTQTQTVWAIGDPMSETAVTNLRTTLAKWQITNNGSGTTSYRTNACINACDSTLGWFSDLPDSRERVNVDIKLQLNTLVVASNVPVSNACNIGGYSWLNYFASSTGGTVATSNNVGRKIVGEEGTESLAVGLNIVRLPSGKTVVIATTSAAEQITVETPFDVAPPTGKRVSWREIMQ